MGLGKTAQVCALIGAYALLRTRQWMAAMPDLFAPGPHVQHRPSSLMAAALEAIERTLHQASGSSALPHLLTALIVVPVSLLGTWAAELEKWSRHMPPFSIEFPALLAGWL